jgi:sugar phosphate isomerase/epimerase
MSDSYPFRLGTTSFILADDYLPNIRFLADKVDDVALLFFEPLEPRRLAATATPDDEAAILQDVGSVGELEAGTRNVSGTERPSRASCLRQLTWIDEALEIRQDHDLSFSVHLPADVKLASVDENIRLDAVRVCVEVIELLAPLRPVAYVCHANSDTRGTMSPAALDALARSLTALGAACGDSARICVENVDLPHERLRSALDVSGVSICYDVGHALMAGQDVLQDLETWLPRCGVLHLHGVRKGCDHHTLDCLPEALLLGILKRYASPAGLNWRVLTLELFNRERWERSLLSFHRAWNSIEATNLEEVKCL